MKINHKAGAVDVVEHYSHHSVTTDADMIALGQISATLALVEQQERIAAAAETANLIAWNLDGEGGSGLRHRIDKELGL